MMSELANIEGDQIVIHIPIAALTDACKIAWDDEYGEEDHGVVVIDAAVFAPDFVRELNEEDEEGTTLVHLMLDKAAIRAADNGAEGLSETMTDVMPDNHKALVERLLRPASEVENAMMCVESAVMLRAQAQTIAALRSALEVARNTVGDLRNGFSRNVDPARWVKQTQAHIDAALSQQENG